MIPAAFDYQRPATLDEALAALAAADGSAKVLAGGMSLLPLMKLRLASPETLIDIGRLEELKGAQADRRRRLRDRRARRPTRRLLEATQLDFAKDAIARASATSRSATGARSAGRSPMPTRRRTCRRSASPSTTRSSSARPRGERVVPLDGFFEGAFQTGIAPDEILVSMRRGPLPAGATGAYRKLEQPASGLLHRRAWPRSSRRAAGSISHARVALTGVGEVAYRAKAVEAALLGSTGRRRPSRPRPQHATDGVDRQRRHPRRSRLSDADGRGLHATRDRGRARPYRLTLTRHAACASSGSLPAGARPRRLAGADPRPRPDGRRAALGKGRRLSARRPARRSRAAEPAPPVTVLIARGRRAARGRRRPPPGRGGRRPRPGCPRPEPEPDRPARRDAGRRQRARSRSSSGSTGSIRSRCSRSSTARSSSAATSWPASRSRPHVVERGDRGRRRRGSPASAARRWSGSRRSSRAPRRGRRQGVGPGDRARAVRGERPGQGRGPRLDDHRHRLRRRRRRGRRDRARRGSRAAPTRPT